MLHKLHCDSLNPMEKENIKEKDDTLTVYEVSYLLLPSLAHEQVPAKAAALKEMLTSAGGAIISDENPVLIDLAYQITKVVQTVRHKATTGYFGWIKFEIAKEGIEAVKKNLDGNDEILRYIIIKTVRENTLLEGKMKLQKEDGVKKQIEDAEGDVPAVEKEIIPEELDKSIDDLVVV